MSCKKYLTYLKMQRELNKNVLSFYEDIERITQYIRDILFSSKATEGILGTLTILNYKLMKKGKIENENIE